MASSTVVMSFMAAQTAQAAYNAPVKGLIEIEETVLFGNYIPSLGMFRMDPRVIVESVSYSNTANASTVVLTANGCTIKGIAGDDTVKLAWVPASNNLNAVQVSTADLNNGLVTVVVPGVNLDINNGGSYFFFVGSIFLGSTQTPSSRWRSAMSRTKGRGYPGMTTRSSIRWTTPSSPPTAPGGTAGGSLRRISLQPGVPHLREPAQPGQLDGLHAHQHPALHPV